MAHYLQKDFNPPMFYYFPQSVAKKYMIEGGDGVQVVSLLLDPK